MLRRFVVAVVPMLHQVPDDDPLKAASRDCNGKRPRGTRGPWSEKPDGGRRKSRSCRFMRKKAWNGCLYLGMFLYLQCLNFIGCDFYF